MSKRVVFFSWQSWSDRAANWNFIQDCLERAIKAIANDESVRLEPVMDRDTVGRPGSPVIADTIFEKVEAADAFVADVSLIAGNHPAPNPNVMAELGYAFAKLGRDRILCIHNLASGRVEDLPFDIRGRRIVTYKLRSKDDSGEWREERRLVREKLVVELRRGIVAILSATDPEVGPFLNEVLDALVEVIIYGEEIEDRTFRLGAMEANDVFASATRDCREWMARSIADSVGLAAVLGDLADDLDKVVQAYWRLSSGTYRAYFASVSEVVALAERIRRDHLSHIVFSRQALVQFRDGLLEKQRQIQSLADRLDSLRSRPGGLEEIHRVCSKNGYWLYRYALFDLDRLQVGLATRLRPLARRLHLFGVSPQYNAGPGRTEAYTVAELQAVEGQFREVITALPSAQ
jgi:hypothetical protein